VRRVQSNIVKAARLKARAGSRGQDGAFYLIGRKGRAVFRREFPTRSRFDTTTVREAGFAEAERSPPNCSPCTKRQVRRGASVLLEVPQRPAAGADRAADHPRARSQGRGPTSGAVVDYEPDEEEILADLLPRYLRTQIFGALLENGQRTGRLDDGDGQCHAQRRRTDQPLTIQYNRSRQAAITTELIEIIAGAEAL
jgi:F-type H+-transporting ATPase subunit gamma